MSKEAVLAFRKKVIDSADLQDQVRAARKAGGGQALVALGKKTGFEFTADELKQVYAPTESGALSDSQLDGVAGGVGPLSKFELDLIKGGGRSDK